MNLLTENTAANNQSALKTTGKTIENKNPNILKIENAGIFLVMLKRLSA